MKIWFYYAKAGGGHRAVASALAKAVKQLNIQGLETREIDLAERTDVFFRFFVEKVYIFLTHHAEWLYLWLYEMNEFKWVIRAEYFLADLLLKKSLKARMVVDKPDAVVATFYMISPLRAAMKELGINIPILMIVTEPFTAPPVWFYYPELKFVVFSKDAEDCGINAGVNKNNIHKFSQVSNNPALTFSEEQKRDLKIKIGLNPDKKTILMIGGANGLPKGKSVLRDLIRSGVDEQVIVVCGENERYRKRINKMAEGNKNILVLGFVENISELMAISDLVITKAGAGVTWECLLNRKPIIITYHIYGQEEGTKDFVVKNGFGWFEPRPERAVDRVRRFFSQPQIGVEIQSKYESFAFKNGNDEIARFIARELKLAEL